MKAKKVYLIGAGPGKADLITLRGFNILKQAEVIIYDYLVDKKILESVPEAVELICCDSLSTKGQSAKRQDKINRLLIKKAKQGKKTVRLKNGDAAIFSRLSEELKALSQAKIEFEIVPGVTAASAASAYSGIPLTDRNYASNCVFVSAQEDSLKKRSLNDWEALAKSGTLVLYMAVNNLKLVVAKLVSAGKDKNTKVAIIENASLTNQRILKGSLINIVNEAKCKQLKPPAIVIVGEVVKFENQFNWLRKNKPILFTGLSPERFFIKGNYLHLPLIKIAPLEDYQEFDSYLRNISDFDWIVFSSRYAVKYFFRRLEAVGYDLRVLANQKFAAIGQSTACALKKKGIKVDLVPKNESSKGLIEVFKKISISGKKIFLPRSNLADKGLEVALAAQGARVTSSFAYRNIMVEELPDLNLAEFSRLMFTSPSTVRNFKKRYKIFPPRSKTTCIGAATLKEAKKCQLFK